MLKPFRIVIFNRAASDRARYKQQTRRIMICDQISLRLYFRVDFIFIFSFVFLFAASQLALSCSCLCSLVLSLCVFISTCFSWAFVARLPRALSQFSLSFRLYLRLRVRRHRRRRHLATVRRCLFYFKNFFLFSAARFVRFARFSLSPSTFPLSD